MRRRCLKYAPDSSANPIISSHSSGERKRSTVSTGGSRWRTRSPGKARSTGRKRCCSWELRLAWSYSALSAAATPSPACSSGGSATTCGLLASACNPQAKVTRGRHIAGWLV